MVKLYKKNRACIKGKHALIYIKLLEAVCSPYKALLIYDLLDLYVLQHDNLPLQDWANYGDHDHQHELMQSVHESELQIMLVLWSPAQGARK